MRATSLRNVRRRSCLICISVQSVEANVKALYANRVRVLPSSKVDVSKTPSLTSSFQTSSKMGFSCAKASGPKADRGCENLAIALSVVDHPDCSSGQLTRHHGIKFLALKAVGTRAVRSSFWPHDRLFASNPMVDFVRSDAGGFLTGSMIAMLVLCAIFFVAGSFN